MATKWVTSPYPGTKVKQPSYAAQSGGFVGVDSIYQVAHGVGRTPIQNTGDTVAAHQAADVTSGAATKWEQGSTIDPASPTS